MRISYAIGHRTFRIRHEIRIHDDGEIGQVFRQRGIRRFESDTFHIAMADRYRGNFF